MLAVMHRIEVFSMVLEAPGPFPHVAAVGDEHSALAGRGNDFILAERKGPSVADRTNGPTFIKRTVRLSAVLDDCQTAATRQFQNWVHVDRPAGQVHDDYCLCSWRELRIDRLRGYVL